MPTIYKPKGTKKRTTNRRAERIAIYNTTRWRELRAVKLMDAPLCEVCKAKGIITPAVEVHHLRSFMATDDPAERERLAYDYDNLQSICEVCHQRAHGKKCDTF